MTDEKDETPTSPDIHFEPVIKLPEVDTKTLEEDEDEILKLRARLYRFVTTENPPEWKERGTGDVKLLKHKDKVVVRLLMRREKTLKICANHYITPWMELKPLCGSDRVWVWGVAADFADEEPKEETLALKFSNAENAKQFKETFERCQKEILEDITKKEGDSSLDESNEFLKKLDHLTVNDSEDSDAGTTETEDKPVQSKDHCEKADATTSKEQEADKD